jgi:Tol biopolymer transport system component
VAAAGGDPVEIPLQFSEQRAPAHLMHPGLSPNGKWVALDDGVAVYTASVAGGNARNLGKGMYPVWSPSGGFLVYSSTEPGKNGSLWEVPVENRTGSTSGPGRPLTVGRGIDSSPSLSKDGSAIAFAAMDRTFNLEEVAFDESAGWVTGPPQSITRGSEVTYFFGQSHDGRSFFYVRRLGTQEGLWRIDRGGSPTQIGADAPLDGGAPRVSPDGASVLYNSRGSIWMMSADGSNPREIVPNAGARSWLPNGREVLYFSNKDRQYKIMDLASKAVRAVSQDPNLIQIHCISADGKWLVTQTSERGNIDLRAIPLDGGPSRVVVATPQEDYHPSMATDGRWLYFHRDHKNIWRVPGPAQNWRPVEPVRVTDFAESGLYVEDPQISADGKRLVYSRGHVTADLWVLRLPQ